MFHQGIGGRIAEFTGCHRLWVRRGSGNGQSGVLAEVVLFVCLEPKDMWVNNLFFSSVASTLSRKTELVSSFLKRRSPKPYPPKP